MRNRITSIIILVSIILLAVAMFRGIKVGNLEILSIEQIKGKNNDLHAKIDEATELTSVSYPNNIQTLEKSFSEYTIEKEKYQELTGVSDKVIEETYETKQYDISYLWRVLGKYAKKRNLTLGIDVQKSNKGNNAYNFNFTISGGYTNTIQFISDIENDSDLYFRIYNFKMSGSGDILTSSFSVRNINIDPSTIKGAQEANMVSE